MPTSGAKLIGLNSGKIVQMTIQGLIGRVVLIVTISGSGGSAPSRIVRDQRDGRAIIECGGTQVISEPTLSSDFYQIIIDPLVGERGLSVTRRNGDWNGSAQCITG